MMPQREHPISRSQSFRLTKSSVFNPSNKHKKSCVMFVSSTTNSETGNNKNAQYNFYFKPNIVFFWSSNFYNNGLQAKQFAILLLNNSSVFIRSLGKGFR